MTPSSRPKYLGWKKPQLVSAGPDEDCGCEAEEWVYHGINLFLHFEPDGRIDLFMDNGDWEDDVRLSGADMKSARREAFAYVRALPHEDK
jgi:hypothetical protein